MTREDNSSTAKKKCLDKSFDIRKIIQKAK